MQEYTVTKENLQQNKVHEDKPPTNAIEGFSTVHRMS